MVSKLILIGMIIFFYAFQVSAHVFIQVYTFVFVPVIVQLFCAAVLKGDDVLVKGFGRTATNSEL